MEMKPPKDMVKVLLDKADASALKAFLRRKAQKDASFRAELSEWLSGRYGEQGETAEKYVDKVQWLFQRVVSKIEGKEALYEYYDYAVDWGELEAGMLDIVEELKSCFAEGICSVVVAPIMEFYRRFHWCNVNCLIDMDYNFCEVHEECINLLTRWVQSPATGDAPKRGLLCELQQISRLSTYSEEEWYGVPELMMKLTTLLQ